MASSDIYGEVFTTALDVIIRRVGWRLSEEALNPLGFKARNELDLETWGMHNNAPDKSLREITELSAGGIHNQEQYDQHLDFMIDALDFYQECRGQDAPPHIFDQLIPVLRDNNHQLIFYKNDLVFADIVLDDNPIAREWRLAPKFVATQENPMGRHLRSFGFVPSLDFVGHKRYTEKIKH